MNARLRLPGRAPRRPATRADRAARRPGTPRQRRTRAVAALRNPSTVGALVLLLLTTVGAVAVATNRSSSTGLSASVQAHSVWLPTGSRGALTRVEATTGRPTAVLYPWQPGTVPEDAYAVSGSTLLVLDADSRLVVWDQASADGARTVDPPADLRPTRLAAADGQLHLVGEDGTVETRPVARADQPGQRTRLPGTAEQVLAVGDTLWVRLAGVGAVVGFRDGQLVTGPQRCGGPCTLLAADGHAYLTSGTTATGLGDAQTWTLPERTDLSRLRPEPGTATAVLAGSRVVEHTRGKARRSSALPGADGLGAPLIVGDRAYLPTADGAVLVAPLDGSAGTRIPVAGPGPVALEPAGMLVLAHDPGSDRLVVIDGVRARAGSKHDEQVPVIGDGPRALAAPDTQPDAPATADAPRRPGPARTQPPAPAAAQPALPPAVAAPGGTAGAPQPELPATTRSALRTPATAPQPLPAPAPPQPASQPTQSQPTQSQPTRPGPTPGPAGQAEPEPGPAGSGHP